MISLESCPICKSKEFVKKLDCKDYSTSKEQFTIVSCETCSFVFTNPRPSDKDLEKYYISDMYISHTNQKNGIFNWLYQTVRKYAINRKLSLLKKTATKGKKRKKTEKSKRTKNEQCQKAKEQDKGR